MSRKQHELQQAYEIESKEQFVYEINQRVINKPRKYAGSIQSSFADQIDSPVFGHEYHISYQEDQQTSVINPG